jgi:hypothetical protein
MFQLFHEDQKNGWHEEDEEVGEAAISLLQEATALHDSVWRHPRDGR